MESNESAQSKGGSHTSFKALGVEFSGPTWFAAVFFFFAIIILAVYYSDKVDAGIKADTQASEDGAQRSAITPGNTETNSPYSETDTQYSDTASQVVEVETETQDYGTIPQDDAIDLRNSETASEVIEIETDNQDYETASDQPQ